MRRMEGLCVNYKRIRPVQELELELAYRTPLTPCANAPLVSLPNKMLTRRRENK